MQKFMSYVRTAVSLILVLACTKLAFASTAQCFRDIRKDTKNTPSPLDDVIHDFGCPTVLCDSEPHNDGACQPGSAVIGGITYYACACDGVSTYPCLLAYKDTLGNSELGGGGGSGGAAACLKIECLNNCVYQDSWVNIGDPEVPQKRNDCTCP